MLFWVVAGLLAAAVAAALARPLLRPPGPEPAEPPDRAIYRGQLADVERDVARGVLAPPEAERLRVEIARRLLLADRADRAGAARLVEAPRRAGLLAVAGGGAVIVLGSLLVYAELGRPDLRDAPRAERVAVAAALRAGRPAQADAEAEAAAFLPPAPDAPEDYLTEVEALRRAVAGRPDDLRGWELLALHEARLGRFGPAARAQERVLALKGDAATARDWLDLVDRMVAAAGGLVSPDAERALGEVAARAPEEPGLFYYLGLLEVQTGRPDRAFPLWRRALEAAPDGPFAAAIRAQVADVAWLAGVDYAPPPVPDAAPGPTAEDLEAAAALAPEEREAMARGMVEGLAARLAAEGGPAEDWARLVSSLGVLGEGERARAILAEGRNVFAGDAEALAALDRAAEGLE